MAGLEDGGELVRVVDGRGKGRRHGPATSRPSIRSSAASSHNNDNEATVSPRRPLRYDRPELQASAASSRPSLETSGTTKPPLGRGGSWPGAAI